MSTSTERSTAVPRIAQRAQAYAMPGETVDGNEFAAVAAGAARAVDRARAGEGPSLLECLTYRHRGHSKSDRNRYRTKEEIDSWIARDPIGRFEATLLSHGLIDQPQIDALVAGVESEIAEGIEFAKNSPAPALSSLTDFVYTQAPAEANHVR